MRLAVCFWLLRSLPHDHAQYTNHACSRPAPGSRHHDIRCFGCRYAAWPNSRTLEFGDRDDGVGGALPNNTNAVPLRMALTSARTSAGASAAPPEVPAAQLRNSAVRQINRRNPQHCPRRTMDPGDMHRDDAVWGAMMFEQRVNASQQAPQGRKRLNLTQVNRRFNIAPENKT